MGEEPVSYHFHMNQMMYSNKTKRGEGGGEKGVGERKGKMEGEREFTSVAWHDPILLSTVTSPGIGPWPQVDQSLTLTLTLILTF